MTTGVVATIGLDFGGVLVASPVGVVAVAVGLLGWRRRSVLEVPM